MLRSQVCARLVGAIAPLALLAVESASVEQSGVFHQVDRALSGPHEAGTEEAGPDSAGTFRARPVRIDFSRLADARANVLRGATDSLTLNLFDDLAFPATVQRIAPTSSGGYALFGGLDGVEFGTVTLVANGDVLAGAIHTPLATYAIRPAGGGVHIVRHVDRSTMRCLAPNGGPATRAVDPGAPVGGADEADPPGHADVAAADGGLTRADDGSVVDILVVYTPAARRAAGGTAAIEAHIDLLIAGAQGAQEPFTLTLTSAGLEFADDPIVAGVTAVKAVHVTALRRRIDALRRANGLAAFPWTDRSTIGSRTPVRGVHVAELRTALDEVYDAVDHTGRHNPIYTEGETTIGAPIRAAHINELRRAVVFLGG